MVAEIDGDPAGTLVGAIVGGRFELQAFVAAGGMGHVYRAHDRETGGDVALKLLPSAGGDAERFVREAEVLAAIDHPGVVRYLAHGTTDDGAHYLAMEWLEGEDLAHRLGRGTLTVGEALSVARCVAAALETPHRRGIVHRDLKPANLFLVEKTLDGLKIIDFGIARGVEQEHLTLTGALVGTPAYMAPEQVRGDPVDPRADVYGLGAVLYRCLSGHPPFVGAHQLAILAKVVLDDAPPLRAFCPEVPRRLEALLERMLAKDPERRPADAAALLADLSDVNERDAESGTRIVAAVTAREERLGSVVLSGYRVSHGDVTLAERSADESGERIRRVIESRGGALDRLPGGTSLVTIPHASSPAESAIGAARCALALASLEPGAPVFVATGRVARSGDQRAGEAIDRAAEQLVGAVRESLTRGVTIDVATAELLEGRFVVTGDGPWRSLGPEIGARAGPRPHAGRPARFVGRDHELAILAATLGTCRSEPRSSSIVITAPAGFGKTRLVEEVVRTATRAEGRYDLLRAGGDPIREASPFGVAAQIVKQEAGISDADPPELRGKKLAALVDRDFGKEDALRLREPFGEILGLPAANADASPGLRAARADPAIMADLVREAFSSFLEARTADGPVLLVVEDLHWADAASVRLLESALEALEERPLCLLATARPGALPFSERFKERGLVEMTLAPLSKGAQVRLVQEILGEHADDAIVREIVRRGAGHPFHLEELARAVAGGRGPDALLDSVLGMVQARLDDLEALPRRLLRAASVFGERFWFGGIAALFGDDMTRAEVRAVLAGLVEADLVLVERSSRWAGDTEYRFRHALFRDAVYATLASADRVNAHRRAAEWLETIGENDAAVLAEHYDRGASPERALRFFVRAAAHALTHNELDRATSHAARALALPADAPTRAALRAIEAEILFWRGSLGLAAERATAAARELRRGGPEWFDAASVAIGALGQLGRNDEVAAWVDDVATADAAPETRGAQAVALCRGMTQLLWGHHGALAGARASLEELVGRADPLDPYEAGWVNRVRGESAWLQDRDVGRCLVLLQSSCDSFEEARAVRPLCLTRLNLASLCGWAGDTARALALLERARADAARVGAKFLVHYAEAVKGLVLAYAGEAEAEKLMRAALAFVGGSPRLTFICHLVAGALALDRGDVATGESHAAKADAIDVAAGLRPASFALGSRVALAHGDVERAVRLAAEGEGIESSLTDLELPHGMAGLALAEAHAARGDDGAARDVLARVHQRLARIAATLPSPHERANFWRRALPNGSIAALASRLGVTSAA